MTDGNNPNSDACNDPDCPRDSDRSDDKTRRRNPTKMSLKAGEISVEAESTEDSLEDIAEVCSDEMECLMRYHIRGEMEMLEEQDLHSILFRGD